MQTTSFQNARPFESLILPCLLAALGWLLCTHAWAQEITVPINSAASQEKPPSQVLLLATATATPKSESGAVTPASSEEVPTYMRDVLPIFIGHCSRCHNSQARFVYDWLDYRTAFRDRWEIKRRIWDSWQGTYYKESMPIQNSPESLTISDSDRFKIRNWVLSGAARGTRPVDTGAKTKAERVEAGRKLFNSICAACHQASGLGVPNLFPPLAGSDFLNSDKRRAIKTVINGRQGEVIVNGMKFNNSMPSFPLSDDDIANALTFVYNSFGNAGLEVTPEEVKTLRAEPADTPAGPPPSKNPYE